VSDCLLDCLFDCLLDCLIVGSAIRFLNLRFFFQLFVNLGDCCQCHLDCHSLNTWPKGSAIDNPGCAVVLQSVQRIRSLLPGDAALCQRMVCPKEEERDHCSKRRSESDHDNCELQIAGTHCGAEGKRSRRITWCQLLLDAARTRVASMQTHWPCRQRAHVSARSRSGRL
jgi:hypothetical protein